MMKAAFIAAALALPLAANAAADLTGVVEKASTYPNGWRTVQIAGQVCYYAPNTNSDDLSATARVSKTIGMPMTLSVETPGWCVIVGWSF